MVACHAWRSRPGVGQLKALAKELGIGLEGCLEKAWLCWEKRLAAKSHQMCSPLTICTFVSDVRRQVCTRIALGHRCRRTLSTGSRALQPLEAEED